MPDAAQTPKTTLIPQLVRHYSFALGLLALLSIAGQIAVQSALHRLQPDTPNTAQAAYQRTLAQHVVVCALALQTSETAAQRAMWESDLRDTAALWRQTTPAPAAGDAGIRGSLTEAAAAKQAMLEAATGLLAAMPPDGSTEKSDLSRYLTPLIHDQLPYQNCMAAVVAGDNAQAAAHLSFLRGMQAVFCVVTLLTLGGLSIPVLRPGKGLFGKTLAALGDLEEKKGELNTALGEADQQIAQMRETLENLSTVDTLTGLKNHRAFQDHIDQEMGRALRHGYPLSLLLLDIDRFKAYNDSYGFAEGDEALKRVSEILNETARASDISARYGGEEFAVILTDTDMMGAVVLGERLRQAIASADGLQRPLTASIGIATLTPNIVSIPALIAQADRALCHAKGDGRNRVSHAHRIPAPLEDEAPVYARAA